MKENETYVNSLQGHLSQLNSAWQELAKNTIDSDFIKGILATTTNLIKFTDEIGGLPVVLAAATSALMLFKGGLILDKVFGAFSSGLSLIKNGLTTLIYALPNAVAAFKSFSAGVITAGTAMQAATPLLSVIALAITGVVAGINTFTKAQEKAQEAALKANEEAKKNIQSKEEEKNKIQEEIDKLHKEIDAYKENEAAKNSAADNTKFLKEKDDEIAKRQDNIDAIQKEIDKNLELREANARLLKAEKADRTGLGWAQTYGASTMDEANRVREGIKEINKELKNAEGNTGAYNRILEEQMLKYNALAKEKEKNNQSTEAENEIIRALSKEISDNSKKYEKDKEVSDEFYDILKSGGDIQDSQIEWLKKFNNYSDEQIERLKNGIDIKSEDTQQTEKQTEATSEQTEKQKELASATEEVNSKFKETNTSIDELQKTYNTLKSAVDEYNNNGYLSIDTLQSLLSLDDEYLSMLSMENGQLVLNTTELDNYTNALVAQRIETAQNAAVQDIWNLAAGNTASMSDTAKTAIANLENGVSTTGTTFSNQVKGINEYTQALLEAKAAAGADTDTSNFEEKANAIINSYQTVFSNISKISSGTYGGGGYSRTRNHRYSGSSKGSSAAKSAQSEYKATIDTLYKYSNALDIAKNRVSALEKELKNTDNLEEQEKITRQLVNALNNQIQKTNELKAAQTSQINDYINQLRQQGFVIDYNNQTNELYINNMQHLADFSGDTAKNLEKLIKNIQSLNKDNVSLDSSVKDLSASTKDYYDQLEKFPEKKLKQYQDLMKDFQQSQLDAVQNQIDDLEEALKQDPQLKALKDQLEAMKAQTDEKDKQAELEEKILAVEKAREALENARRQKTLQVWTEQEGWIWTQDPDEIANAQQELLDAEKDLENTRNNQNQEALEKQIEDLENSYQDQIDKLQDFLDEQNYQIDKANRGAIQSFEELAAAMKKYGIDSAENLAKAKKWLDDYNQSLAKAKSNISTLAMSGNGILYSSEIQGLSTGLTSMPNADYSGISLSGVKFTPTGDTNNSSIYIDKIELPNVSNANEFVEALKTLPTLASAQATSRT